MPQESLRSNQRPNLAKNPAFGGRVHESNGQMLHVIYLPCRPKLCRVASQASILVPNGRSLFEIQFRKQTIVRVANPPDSGRILYLDLALRNTFLATLRDNTKIHTLNSYHPQSLLAH